MINEKDYGKNGGIAEFYNGAREFSVMRNLYDCAVKQLKLKLEILNNEFNVRYSRNPIHHIESRLKSADSIIAKLLKEPARFDRIGDEKRKRYSGRKGGLQLY